LTWDRNWLDLAVAASGNGSGNGYDVPCTLTSGRAAPGFLAPIDQPNPSFSNKT